MKRSSQIYQIRMWIRKISPAIWRRVHVYSTTNLEELHYIIQIAFSWRDIYLNKFKIRTKEYGISHPGGMMFFDDPSEVLLENFNLHINDRFHYEYNYFNLWQVELRLEKILPPNSKHKYPLFISGNQAGPPDDCGGPWGFMELKDKHNPFSLFSDFIHHQCGEDSAFYDEDEEASGIIDDLDSLRYWVSINRFDRKKANKYLRLQEAGEDIWRYEPEVLLR